MDKKESLLKQRDEAKKEAAQYENQVKILLNKQRDAERHARSAPCRGLLRPCGRDGEVPSPNPLCASRNGTPASRLFCFRWPISPATDCGERRKIT